MAEPDESTGEAATGADIEDRYDFESFGPDQLADMTSEEWETAFDPATWITGEDLLVRVETELRRRVAERDVFAVVERITSEGVECVLAYSDEGYALVRPDGSVEGFGTVMRDVKPTVALCSIPDYEPEEPPADAEGLPDPVAVETARSDLGNRVLQVVGVMLVFAGLSLVGAWILTDLPAVAGVAGIGFAFAALVLLFIVANARLSSRYRAEEYRDRLRAVGVGSDDRPPFLPIDEDDDG